MLLTLGRWSFGVIWIHSSPPRPRLRRCLGIQPPYSQGTTVDVGSLFSHYLPAILHPRCLAGFLPSTVIFGRCCFGFPNHQEIVKIFVHLESRNYSLLTCPTSVEAQPTWPFPRSGSFHTLQRKSKRLSKEVPLIGFLNIAGGCIQNPFIPGAEVGRMNGWSM